MKHDLTRYELLDFGRGRKLERIGGVVLDRPCPAADFKDREQPSLWREADVSYDLKPRAGWSGIDHIPESWKVELAGVGMLLRPTPFGHIGIFPEQEVNWRWMQSLMGESEAKPIRCLNLFAYTGASSLILAKLGCHVTHVDASRPTIQWARDNAAHNALDGKPIRWIQEDASRFVEREIRRGNRYEMVLLDPPTYGHGPKGESWDFDRDIQGLLESVFEVLSDDAKAVLWTGHSETESLMPLMKCVADRAHELALRPQRIERSTLSDLAELKLDCGFRIRWTSQRVSGI